MSIPTYDDVLAQAQALAPTDQLRLLEDLSAHVRRQLRDSPPRGILELRGLGKHIWGNVDAQEYVEKERRSWMRR